MFFRFNGEADGITLVQRSTMDIHCGAEQQNTSGIMAQRGTTVQAVSNMVEY